MTHTRASPQSLLCILLTENIKYLFIYGGEVSLTPNTQVWIEMKMILKHFIILITSRYNFSVYKAEFAGIE